MILPSSAALPNLASGFFHSQRPRWDEEDHSNLDLVDFEFRDDGELQIKEKAYYDEIKYPPALVYKRCNSRLVGGTPGLKWLPPVIVLGLQGLQGKRRSEATVAPTFPDDSSGTTRSAITTNVTESGKTPKKQEGRTNCLTSIHTQF